MIYCVLKMERTKKLPETMSPGKWLRGLKMFTLVEELGEFKTILNKFGVCVCKKYNTLYQVSEVMAWGHDWNLQGGELGSTK